MCPLCSGQDRVYLKYDYLGWKDYRLKRCRECGLVFTDPLPSKSFLDHFYQEYDNTGQKDLYYHNLENYRETIDGQLLENSFLKLNDKYSFNRDLPILDLGSGGGAFLDILKRHGFKSWGVELSKSAVEFAQKKFGVDSEQISVLDYETEANSMGVVFMWDLLEHLPDQQKIVNKINSWLVPGGYLIIETPNSNSLISGFILFLKSILIVWPAKWFFGFHHLFWHSQKSVARLLGEGGFEVLEIKKKNTPARRIFSNNLKYILAKIFLMGVNMMAKISGRQNKIIIIAKKI